MKSKRTKRKKWVLLKNEKLLGKESWKLMTLLMCEMKGRNYENNRVEETEEALDSFWVCLGEGKESDFFQEERFELLY